MSSTARGVSSQMRRQRLAQGGQRVFAGEIVDAAVALGLAEHREDGRGIDFAGLDERHEPGHVARTFGRNADHVDRDRAIAHSASPLDQKINRRSAKPMA